MLLYYEGCQSRRMKSTEFMVILFRCDGETGYGSVFLWIKPGYCLSALLQGQVETGDDNLLKIGQALETNISRFAS